MIEKQLNIDMSHAFGRSTVQGEVLSIKLTDDNVTRE